MGCRMSSFVHSPIRSGPSPQEQLAPLVQHVPKRLREPKTFPLSLTQPRLWLLAQVMSGSPAYNEDYASRLKTSLHIPAIERTLNQIVRRHRKPCARPSRSISPEGLT